MSSMFPNDPAALAGALGGLGGEPGEPAEAPEAVEEAPEESITSAPKGDHLDFLREAIGSLQEYMKAEQDDEDLALATKLVAQAQTLLAKNQKEADGALGIGPGEKFLRKQTALGGGQ